MVLQIPLHYNASRQAKAPYLCYYKGHRSWKWEWKVGCLRTWKFSDVANLETVVIVPRGSPLLKGGLKHPRGQSYCPGANLRTRVKGRDR